MAWYYKDGDQELGPVSKAELQTLIKSKQVTAGTLVRSSEMAEWRTLSEMVQRKPDNRPAPPPPAPSRSLAADSPPTPDTPAPSTALCSQCGRGFPEDQVIRYENQVICAACKPMFVQKLREGADRSMGVMHYGGFWIRLVAKIIDNIIMNIIMWAIMIPMGALTIIPLLMDPNRVPPLSAIFTIVAGVLLVVTLVPVAYNTLFVGRFAATPGKMACRLEVVNPEGGRISYKRALGRSLGEMVTVLTVYIGYIIAAFDAEKRALHDYICSTRVIYK